MRTCPKCKATIESDTAKFCRHCGSPLSGASVPHGGGATMAPQKVSDDDKSQKEARAYVRTTEIFIPADDTPRKARPKPAPKAPTQPTMPMQPVEPPLPEPAPAPKAAPAPVRTPDEPDPKASYGLFSAMGHVIRNYAKFSGRAPRSEYWYMCLFSFLALISWILMAMLFAADAVPEALLMVWALLYCAYSVFMIVPSMAVACRRLHDTNRSGWMMLLALIPWVGAVILLIMLAQKGTPYTNTYGPVPGT